MATSPWYKTGTAKFTAGSSTVTGTGTEWVKYVRAGDGIQGPDGKLYQITNIASNTSLSISPVYGGDTQYWTIPIQGYVKQLADSAAQLVRDFEGGATEAIDAADRAKQSAVEAKSSENKSLTEANRSKSEADRAKTEADRSQQAADDAVAVVTNGGGSIDPEAGKWPVAMPDATIKSAWVHELDFMLDKLRVATNKALYGDGPYPVLDFQFAGAKYLDPRITFTRNSRDFRDGKVYEINEPVITEQGLWSSGGRTNLLRNTVNPTIGQWTTTRISLTILDDGWCEITDSASGENTYQTSQSFNALTGIDYVLSCKLKKQSADLFATLQFGNFSAQEVGIARRVNLRTGKVSQQDNRIGIIDAGDSWDVYINTKAIDTANISSVIGISTLESTSTYEGTGLNKIQFKFAQTEVGTTPTPYIPTDGAQVTVAADSTRVLDKKLPESFCVSAIFPDPSSEQSLISYRTVTGTTEQVRVYLTEEKKVWVRIRSSGVDIFHAAIADFTPGYNHKIAISFTSGNALCAFDGQITDLGLATKPSIDILRFGAFSSASNLESYIKSHIEFSASLSEQELKDITS